MTAVTTAQEIDKLIFRRDFAAMMAEEAGDSDRRAFREYWGRRAERLNRELAVLRRYETR